MIYFYSGTPGSGKSLHMAMDIYSKIFKQKQDVIANFPMNLDFENCKEHGNFTYLNNQELTVDFLVKYAKENHDFSSNAKENQTLVCIDEAGIMFNPRMWNDKNRMNWIVFLSQHRHYKYNFIITSQFDLQIDKQIRPLFEYEYKHRKINNFGLLKFLPFHSFICVVVWYGCREKINSFTFRYKKKYAELYDTAIIFE